jgi:hypothetical protein
MNEKQAITEALEVAGISQQDQEKKHYGKVGQTWLAKDGSGYLVGIIIGKYFDKKNGLSYCLKNSTKLLDVKRSNLLSLVH